jgi:hypothetical protein
MTTRNKSWLGGFVLCALAGCATTAVPTQAPSVKAPSVEEPAAQEPAATVHHTAVAATKSAKGHPSVSQTWLDFRDQRSAYVETLAKPLLDCANAKLRDRTPECTKRVESFEVPYALTALYRVTKDPRFADAAEKAIDRKRVSKHDRFDDYTAAWFLAFSREREVAMHNTDLRKEADAVAARLESGLTDLDDFQFAQKALFGSEENVAFTLSNLWSWADHRADSAMTTRLVSYTKSRMLGADMDSWCPMPVDGEPENFEFMPPCLQRATTVLEVIPEQISNKWIREFVAAQDKLEPIRSARLTEHGVLNFSRSWGLWALYEATNNGLYRDMYVSHMQAQLGELQRTAKKEETIDPWYATYGVRALVESY